MRTFIFLFCATVFALAPNNLVSQHSKIKIVEDEALTVDEVFDLIMEQTEYRFFYEEGIFKDFPKVQVHKGRISTNVLLKQSLDIANLNIEVTKNNSILISEKSPNATVGGPNNKEFQVEISGTITDENGQPLAGANILEKGTANGTQADFDGNFAMPLEDPNSILVISYLGFATKEVRVNGQSVINIALEESSAGLEEVVVVGYGTQTKSSLTGAVVQTTGDKIVKAPVGSVSNALAGRLPGVIITQGSGAPGADDSNIMIRGASTFGDNSALIVIDGVPSRDPNGLNRLDPSDIESVSVLKDASAAIYGARAANGVILVTTKRGKLGEPIFTYDGSYGVLSPTMGTDVANAYEFAIARNSKDEYEGRNLSFSEEALQQYKDGVLPSYNWYETVGNSYLTKHNISVKGGTESVRYYASSGYLEQDGLVKRDDITGNKQLNLRVNLDVMPSDNLGFNVDVALRHQKRKEHQQFDSWGISDAFLPTPMLPIFVDDDPRYPAEGRGGNNPINIGRNKDEYRQYETVVANTKLGFDYKIAGLEGLSLKGFLTADFYTVFNENFFSPKYYFEKNSDGEIVEVPRQNDGTNISLTERYQRTSSLTPNISLNYGNKFGKHSIDAFLAYEQNTQRYDNFTGYKEGYATISIKEFNGGPSDREKSSVDGGAFESARKNFLGRASYNYASKYFAQAIFRYDGSQKFPEGSRYGFFPGLQAGWVMTQEGFLKGNNFVNFLKIRASWGQLGNDRIPDFQYIGRYIFGDNYVVNGTLENGLIEQGAVNPDITWETAENLNIGLDATFLDNKLRTELDLFKVKTKDILATPSLTVPDYTGIDVPRQNIGTHENRGFELTLNYQDNIGDFEYSVGGNISYAKNKTTEFNETPMNEPYMNQTGRPWGAPLLYKSTGIYRTQAEVDNTPHLSYAKPGDLILADLNEDGVINGDDRYRLDKTNTPTTQFGLDLTTRYKGFDLAVLFHGLAGDYRRLEVPGWMFAQTNGLAYAALNSYSSNNPNSELPRIGTQQDADFWYKDSWILRLKNVNLGYTIPMNLSDKVALKSVRLYFSGQNLFTTSSHKKYGIDDSETSGNWVPRYPITKNFIFGINVSF